MLKTHLPYLNRKKSVPHDLKLFGSKPPEYWQDWGEKRALYIFHEAAERVPAYKNFLLKHKINHRKIKTIADFKFVPYIDKNNYLMKYPLEEMVWEGDLTKLNMISRSSGSSGDPFYWPRGVEQEAEVAYIHEVIFRTSFEMHKKKTLLIVGYAMGTWVAGTFTLTTGLDFAEQPQPVTIVTPGNNSKEIIELATRLGPYYDQVVLCGYPPFIKEVIDIGREQKVNWPALNIKFILGAEPFSEAFRNYLLSAAGCTDELRGTMNTIGSADAAILGHETPLSIAVRRAATRHQSLWEDLFPAHRIPTLAQYYPWMKYFEVINNEELIFTSNGGIPLMRYNIHDHGSIISHDEMSYVLQRHEIDMNGLVGRDSYGKLNWTLPFICIYGKTDNTLPFYGAKIYPENIRSALESGSTSKEFSGKFQMYLTYDDKFNPSLMLNIELASGTKASKALEQQACKHIFSYVKQVNSEFASASQGIGWEKAMPQVTLYEFGSAIFKSDSIKHKWAHKGIGK